jgi:N-acetyltransferase
VRTIVDDELGYVASDSDTALRSAYLYIRKRRVVGLVTAEVIERGYALQNNFERSKHPQKAMIGIHHMWVHSRFRKQGIATRLVDAVRKKMVFGLVVPPERLAFSSPTEAGVKFARRYVNHASRGESSKDVLVYECS